MAAGPDVKISSALLITRGISVRGGGGRAWNVLMSVDEESQPGLVVSHFYSDASPDLKPKIQKIPEIINGVNHF